MMCIGEGGGEQFDAMMIQVARYNLAFGDARYNCETTVVCD